MACSDEHPAPVRSNVFERTYQAKLAGCRYSGSRASTPESIPLPREKPRKAVASQNALRQAGMSGHEDSGPIWTSHGSQTRPGRAPTRDRSQSRRGRKMAPVRWARSALIVSGGSSYLKWSPA